MITPNIKQVEKMAKDYSIIPICKEIYGDIITPIVLLRKISRISQKYYLLESVEGGERWARYSFLGFDPIVNISCKKGRVFINDGTNRSMYAEKPFDVLRNLMKEYKAPKLSGMPPFSGGLVGYFSYEMVGYTEEGLNLKDSETDDFNLMLFDKVIAYDHLKQKIIIIVNMKTDQVSKNYEKAISDIEDINKVIMEELEPSHREKNYHVPVFTCNLSKEKFYEMVEETKDYIKKGEILQAVISRRFEAEYKGDLLNAYRVLRTINPSPYMVFLQSEGLQVIGSSPETLVSLQDGRLSTFPIAGSRPRGKSKEEDMLLEQELMADKKELSEHKMLVDLAKNELGKISEHNSIEIKDFMKVQKFSKIMHITSKVEGKICNEKDAFDAIETILPAGTLSGSPKMRACQIIDKLEKDPRGIYGGAIGYIDFTGNMDTCIAIRMGVKIKDKVYVQAGSGIVLDSQAEKEYEEAGNKARAVIEAIQRSKEVDENDCYSTSHS